jgi:hypothetical protein
VRWQWRISGAWTYGAQQDIFASNAYAIRIFSDGRIALKSWADGTTDCAVSSVRAGSDVTLLMQRRFAGTAISEVWAYDTASGALVQSATCTGPAGTPNNAGSHVTVAAPAGGSLAYMRVYSTASPLGSAPSNKWGGDLNDWEFEGNGDDQTSHLPLTGGEAAYGSTPALPPVASFGAYPDSRTWVIRADGASYEPLVVHSKAFSSTDNAVLSCSWTREAGPGPLNFGDPTSCTSTTVGGTMPGTYTISLHVSDGASSSVVGIKYGGVQVDAAGYVLVPSAMRSIVGLLIPWGTSPWPWFDLTERADADAMQPWQSKPPRGVPLSGTLTFHADGTVLGYGTHFRSELSPGGGIGLNWPAPDGTTGMWRTQVNSITDDTHAVLSLTVNNGYGTRPGLPWVGITAESIKLEDFTHWGNHSDSTPSDWNFYDNALGLYRLYYRTGIDTYLEQARALADGWYHLALDHGYNLFGGQTPKWMGLAGIIARAVEGHKEHYWKGLHYWFSYPIGWNTQFTTAYIAPVRPLEPRDAGFQLRAVALAARSDPDAGRRALYCGWVVNSLLNFWPSAQDPTGRLEEDIYSENQGYGGARDFSTGYFGASAWRATIAVGGGLTAAYDSLREACSATPRSAEAERTALREVVLFADYAKRYAVGPDQQTYYEEGYTTNTQSPLQGAGTGSQMTPVLSGSITLTAGSAAVVGSGTHFTHYFIGAPCHATASWCHAGAVVGTPLAHAGSPISAPAKWLGVSGNHGGFSPCNIIQQVVSVDSDTHLTLTTVWPPECGSGTTHPSAYAWNVSWQNPTACAPAVTPFCSGPSWDWAHDMPNLWMWLAERSGPERAAQLRDWAGRMLGADYGGPAGGPGTTTACGGPFCMGKHGNFDWSMNFCGSTPPPCQHYGGVVGPGGVMGKSYGMSAGSGDATVAIARWARSVPPAGHGLSGSK